ncbi:MAG TPA: hypothetical protein VKT00_02910, partial [Casimicrobiaceae bacterium]|nr:hypothetical protein [Casimicrobiaceae bacterium]
FKRIEVAFPLRDPELAERVVAEGLDIYLRDTEGAWELAADGSWTKLQPAAGATPFSAQADLLTRLSNGRSGLSRHQELPAYLQAAP